MATLGSDGSVVLSAAEAAQLRAMVDRWETAARAAGADTATPLVDLGDAVRTLLAGLPLRWRPASATPVNLDRAVVTKDAEACLVRDAGGRAWLSAGEPGHPAPLNLRDAQDLCRWLAAWIREQP
jgi:hypothetical protein